MIETKNLTKSFGEHVAVRDLSILVEPGEILGFLGPNGAGKSTTVKVLTCLTPPTGGSAQVAGFDVTQDSLEVRRRIGYVPESGALYETLTAYEFLDTVAKLHHLEEEAAEQRINEFLTIFGLAGDQHRMLSEFSKGMKQKVLITSALLSNPEVLFFDEPLNGLDANAALIVKELLRQFAEQGRTILFCSHILDVVERICTKIIIINNGQVLIEGTADSIAASTESETLEEAFHKLTGILDVAQVSQDLLSALQN